MLEYLSVEAIGEICMFAQERAREWWDRFLKTGGLELFGQTLNETKSAEQITIDIQSATLSGKPVPDNVTLMILMHAAVRTLAVALAVDQWATKQAAEAAAQEPATCPGK
jgi:hypothetical protein